MITVSARKINLNCYTSQNISEKMKAKYTQIESGRFCHQQTHSARNTESSSYGRKVIPDESVRAWEGMKYIIKGNM